MGIETTLNKLRFDSMASNLILNAPDSFKSFIDEAIFDHQFDLQKRGNYDFIQVFATEQQELEELIQSAKPVGKYDAVFWACYPKKAGKIKSNIKRETVWEAFDKAEMKAVAAVSIDENWSAIRARPKGAVGKR